MRCAVVRGFTLIETLAAVTLLAVMAVACIPLIADATRAVDAAVPPEPTEWDRIELAQLGDQIAAAPEAFGIDLAALGEAIVEWPEAVGRPPVQVTRLESRDEHGVWILLRCADHTSLRWVELDEVAPPTLKERSR